MSITKESSDELNPGVRAPATQPASRAKRTAADHFALALATCGVGFFPIAPGTLGSLVGVALFLSIHRAADSVLVPYALAHHLFYFSVEAIQLSLMLVVI